MEDYKDKQKVCSHSECTSEDGSCNRVPVTGEESSSASSDLSRQESFHSARSSLPPSDSANVPADQPTDSREDSSAFSSSAVRSISRPQSQMASRIAQSTQTRAQSEPPGVSVLRESSEHRSLRQVGVPAGRENPESLSREGSDTSTSERSESREESDLERGPGFSGYVGAVGQSHMDRRVHVPYTKKRLSESSSLGLSSGSSASTRPPSDSSLEWFLRASSQEGDDSSQADLPEDSTSEEVEVFPEAQGAIPRVRVASNQGELPPYSVDPPRHPRHAATGPLPARGVAPPVYSENSPRVSVGSSVDSDPPRYKQSQTPPPNYAHTTDENVIDLDVGGTSEKASQTRPLSLVASPSGRRTVSSRPRDAQQSPSGRLVPRVDNMRLSSRQRPLTIPDSAIASQTGAMPREHEAGAESGQERSGALQESAVGGGLAEGAAPPELEGAAPPELEGAVGGVIEESVGGRRQAGPTLSETFPRSPRRVPTTQGSRIEQLTSAAGAIAAAVVMPSGQMVTASGMTDPQVSTPVRHKIRIRASPETEDQALKRERDESRK